MKLRHAPHAANARLALAVVMLVVLAALMVGGCAHPQKRNDWRNPAPPMACRSDADCRGGTCAMDLGASQGTCAPAGGSSGAPGDGGAPSPGLNPGPGPNVQPSPGDIQI